MDRKDIIRKVRQWCSECSMAHDFTCSGARAEKCNAQKIEFMKKANERLKDTVAKAEQN